MIYCQCIKSYSSWVLLFSIKVWLEKLIILVKLCVPRTFWMDPRISAHMGRNDIKHGGQENRNGGWPSPAEHRESRKCLASLSCVSSHACSSCAGEGSWEKGVFAHLMRPGSLGIDGSCQKSTSLWCFDKLSGNGAMCKQHEDSELDRGLGGVPAGAFVLGAWA